MVGSEACWEREAGGQGFSLGPETSSSAGSKSGRESLEGKAPSRRECRWEVEVPGNNHGSITAKVTATQQASPVTDEGLPAAGRSAAAHGRQSGEPGPAPDFQIKGQLLGNSVGRKQNIDYSASYTPKVRAQVRAEGGARLYSHRA